jgi:hypothetical protein
VPSSPIVRLSDLTAIVPFADIASRQEISVQNHTDLYLSPPALVLTVDTERGGLGVPSRGDRIEHSAEVLQPDPVDGLHLLDTHAGDFVGLGVRGRSLWLAAAIFSALPSFTARVTSLLAARPPPSGPLLLGEPSLDRGAPGRHDDHAAISSACSDSARRSASVTARCGRRFPLAASQPALGR